MGLPLAALVLLLAGFSAATSQSLWIDETATALRAQSPTLADWWDRMREAKSSDLQMPLYMVYAWVWEKPFGSGEWALRAANVPWLLLGLLPFLSLARENKVGFWALTAVAAATPFTWFYLDEARPYTMQLGASFLALTAAVRLRRLIGDPNPSQGGNGRDAASSLKRSGVTPASDAARTRSERRWIATFCAALFFLAGSSMLGAIWTGPFLLAAAILLHPRRAMALLRRHWMVWLLGAIGLALLAGYYLWTLTVGARASTLGRTDARNIFFIAYELLGFGGLGPSRLDIRQSGLAAFRPFIWALLAYSLALGAVATSGLLMLWRRPERTQCILMGLSFALAALFLVGVGFTMEFRVLARHFTPLMPLVTVVLGAGVALLWSRSPAGRAAAILFVAASLASCLSLRLGDRHAKDDYRSAARQARAALDGGAVVWWNAAFGGAVYYGVPIGTNAQDTARALYVFNPAPDWIDAPSAVPGVIVSSKTDVYDAYGVVQEFRDRHGYELAETYQAFTIWRRNPNPSR